MPTVPLYPTGGRVAPEARGPVYQSDRGASIDAFGGTGDGMQRASQKLESFSNTLAAIAQDDNEREAKKLDIEIAKRRDRLLWGDGTEQNPGFLSVKGENALSAAGATQQALQKVREEVLGSTKNPKVRQLAEAMSAQQIEAGLNLINRHITDQRLEANKTVSEARMQTAISSAVKDWNNPAAMRAAGEVINGEMTSRKRAEGWDDEVLKQKLDEARGHLVGSVVKQAIAADNVEAAQKILDANEASLPAAARVELYTLLRDQSVTKQGQALADQAFAKFGSDSTKALAWMQSVATGKTRDNGWEHYQNFVSSANAQVERARAAIHFTQSQEDRNDPVSGRAATNASLLYERKVREANNLRLETERQQNAAATAGRDEWTTAAMKNGGIIDFQAVADDPRLATKPEYKVEIERFATQLAKGEPPAAVSARTMADLFQRINLPDGDPNKITDLGPVTRAVGDGKLSSAHFTFLEKAITDARTPEGSRLGQRTAEFFKDIQSQFTKTNLFANDALGDLAFGQYKEYVRDELEKARKAGKDPFALLRRDTPESLANPGVISLFQAPADRQLDAKLDSMSRQGGEQFGKLPVVTTDSLDDPVYKRLPSKAEFMLNGKKYTKP